MKKTLGYAALILSLAGLAACSQPQENKADKADTAATSSAAGFFTIIKDSKDKDVTMTAQVISVKTDEPMIIRVNHIDDMTVGEDTYADMYTGTPGRLLVEKPDESIKVRTGDTIVVTGTSLGQDSEKGADILVKTYEVK